MIDDTGMKLNRLKLIKRGVLLMIVLFSVLGSIIYFILGFGVCRMHLKIKLHTNAQVPDSLVFFLWPIIVAVYSIFGETG